MEKRIVTPVAAPPPAPEPVRDDTPLKIAEALRAQSELGQITAQVMDAMNKQLTASLGVHAQALKDVVAKITATREVDVEVSSRDSDGRIKTLRVRSTISKTNPLAH